MEPKSISKEDSLVAAIEGNYSKMAHADLVLTCQMLTRGRAAWRKEAEDAKKEIEHLNKALALKLDATDAGKAMLERLQKAEEDCTILKDRLQEVRAHSDKWYGRTMSLETRLQAVENAAAQLIYAIRRGVDQEELGEAMAACEKAIQSKEPK